MVRKARIVATIGPSVDSEPVLRSLIQAGVDVARLNFSHGTHEEHLERIRLLRALSKEFDRPVTILQDLQGPKMRVGDLPDGGIPLKAGQVVLLAPTDSDGAEPPSGGGSIRIPMDVPQLARSVRPGNRVLLDDGQLELQVTEVRGDVVEARVMLGGLLKSHKGVNLPGASLDIPAFSEKDRLDLEFGLKHGIDVLAISFVRQPQDIEVVRHAIREIDPNKLDTPIIAKIERPEALDHLHEIIHAADGVMVARGDLAVETSPALVPIIQKRLIELAHRHAKIVITATQMLDSMIHNPRPTRAEASDVANAIFDGTDAVMLSGETASGEYPVEAVTMMDSIIREAEANADKWGHGIQFPDEVPQEDSISIARAAKELAEDRNVANVALFTQTGRTAVLMSKARPKVPILAFTPEERTYRRLGLLWGVKAFLVPYASSVESMLSHVEVGIAASTDLQPGQQIVFISGYPVGERRLPNFALLYTLGDTGSS